VPTWTHILVHHTASGDSPGRDFDGIRRFHTDPPPAGRGWRDIGYHAVIERIGQSMRVIMGRPWTMPGAHSPSMNAKALGVAVVGNFEHERVDDEHLTSLAGLCALWCRTYGIDPANIHGHRDHRQTACPGANLYAALGRVRELTTEILDAPEPGEET